MRAAVGLRAPSAGAISAVKLAVFVLALLPLASLVHGVYADALGANPVEAVTHSTGEWALILLCVTLGVTPARRLTGAGWLIRLRRMLGLFAFFYALLHLATYVWFDQWFDWGAMAADIVDRPFVTLGVGALALMLPLALTSTSGMMRRLGARWKRLHRLIYPAAVLAVLHLWWIKLGKNDLAEPMQYAAIVGVLLAMRLWWWLRSQRR